MIKGRTKDIIEERGVRLFYANKNNDQHQIQTLIVPIEDRIHKYRINKKNSKGRNYFSEEIRVFEQIFPAEKDILKYNDLVKVSEDKKNIYENNKNLFEEAKKKFREKGTGKIFFSDLYFV